MEKYKYVDAFDQIQEITVSKEVLDTVRELDKQDKLDERRETRRCQSLEASMENGFDLIDDTADIDVIIDKKERYKALYSALAKLPAKQRELIQKVFFEGISQAEIARREDVSRVAIAIRLQKILAKLRKLLI